MKGYYFLLKEGSKVLTIFGESQIDILEENQTPDNKSQLFGINNQYKQVINEERDKKEALITKTMSEALEVSYF